MPKCKCSSDNTGHQTATKLTEIQNVIFFSVIPSSLSSPSFNRKCTPQTRGNHVELESILHPACSHPASGQPPSPKTALHSWHEPLHSHWPHTHGDCGGHLQEAGSAPVPGHSQWVSRNWNCMKRKNVLVQRNAFHIRLFCYCYGQLTCTRLGSTCTHYFVLHGLSYPRVYPVICMAWPNHWAAPPFPCYSTKKQQSLQCTEDWAAETNAQHVTVIKL